MNAMETTTPSDKHEAPVMREAVLSLIPKTFDEWMRFATMVSNSKLCPKGFERDPGSVFLACQMGLEVGLKPMQALQNIAVINGRPSVWGDAALALCRNHPAFLDIQESVVNGVATCVVKRKGCSDVTGTFSEEQAKKARLWNKSGPWTDYPNRMLQMRARGFALRDQFPDALRGLNIAEEVMDYDEIVVDNKTSVLKQKSQQTPPHIEPTADVEQGGEYLDFASKIKICQSTKELQNVFKEMGGVQFTQSQQSALYALINKRKKEFEEEKLPIDGDTGEIHE